MWRTLLLIVSLKTHGYTAAKKPGQQSWQKSTYSLRISLMRFYPTPKERFQLTLLAIEVIEIHRVPK